MYDDILIPTDGSHPAEAAARYGRWLADVVDATVHIMSVVDVRSYSEQLADVDRLIREQRSALEDRARDAVTAIEELIDGDSEARYTSVIEHGIPHEAILDYTSENGIDLVTMGTHGRTGMDRFMLGSVTERVVRTSDVPVLAVPPTMIEREMSDIDSILIPTDGSPAANAAVDHGLSLADWYGASVHVFYVIQTGRGLPDLGDPGRIHAEETVEAVAEQAARQDINVETHVQSGTPHERIQNFVRKQGVDLVTMGTQGRSGLSRHLLGSVTEKVLRTSDAPILTVRSGQ